MGQILLKYYEYVNGLLGLPGKQELAKITKIPSILAGSKPDSPENIKLFKDAVKSITKKEAPNY